MNYNWSPLVSSGILAALIILANILRKKVGFIRRGLVPTAVIAGFILLLLRNFGLLNMDASFLEQLTYHGIAIGFIAMSLRIASPESKGAKYIGAKSGALIVSTYLVQGVVGLIITVGLAYTVMPKLFKAAGVLLPMGYGQGPGQANNVGTSYEALGFIGGRSFALAIAAAGYLCACIVGVIYLNYLVRKKRVERGNPEDIHGSVTLDTYQDKGELPISESVDRFSIQAALVLFVYLLTYLLTLGITSGLEAAAPGLAKTVNSLLWGFNFILGSMVAMLSRGLLDFARKKGIIHLQYQNTYLLSRLSGLAFDVMIVAGIGSIEMEQLEGLWLPFVLLAIAGGVVTFYYIKHIAALIYPTYYYEGIVSMYGMLCGTISSGVLLLREIDPEMKTPAANNLITGSSYGIVFGAPILILINLAVASTTMLFVSIGIMIVYFGLLYFFIRDFKSKEILAAAKIKETE